MNPFLEIPVCHAGKPDNPDLPEKEVTGRILPGEIAFHYPGYHWGAIIVLKSGYTFLTTWDCEMVDAARELHSEAIKKMPSNLRNIQVKPKNQKEVL